ncbi:Transmembrane protein [Fasciola hepatica]|uniref:BOS complex subunit TMEM147 n=1 Tax=Fasciola hepatica TaxID=6192 RepID=A0A4E0RER9_FASHE|nr:Transmembrane protein [Fasciola hepatica]
MGLFYLANCLALAAGPYVLVYRCSGMKENDAFWKCFKYGMLYGLMQMLKFFLATLIPHDVDTSPKNVFYMDIMSVILDLVFIYSIAYRASSRNEFNLLVACMGWSTAALVSTKFVPIWFGTKGVEFNAIYLCLSYEANLEMLLTFVQFYALWLLIHKQGSFSNCSVVLFILTCASMRQMLFSFIDRVMQSIFQALLSKTVIAFVLGTFVLSLKRTMKLDKVNKTPWITATWKSLSDLIHPLWTQHIVPALGLKPVRENRASLATNAKRHN